DEVWVWVWVSRIKKKSINIGHQSVKSEMHRPPSPPAICRSSASDGRSLRAVRGETYKIHFGAPHLAGARLEMRPDSGAAQQHRVIAVCLREGLAFGLVAV